VPPPSWRSWWLPERPRPPASAADWAIFKSDRFGFAMLLAPGMQWEARDFGSGWGGVAARKNEVAFLAIVKLGYEAPPRELGEAAITLTRVPAAAWRKVDEGKGQAGWKWWQTYEARNSATGRPERRVPEVVSQPDAVLSATMPG
jgi:hypothetical protein